jgi:hypothetical protein
VVSTVLQLQALGRQLRAQRKALGLQLNLQATAAGHSKDTPPTGWLPVRVTLADYPQLKTLAWQVQGTHYLTLIEAHDIYERNARHLDQAKMTAQEQALIDALQQAFGRSGGDV